VNAKIFVFEFSDDVLQRVAIASRHAHDVALNRGLHFYLRVLDELYDFLRLLLRNAFLNRRSLSDGAAGGWFNSTVIESFKRHTTAHQLLLQNIVHVA